MYIPMIFFTIVIEKRKLTPEEREARRKQKQAIESLEAERFLQASLFPEYVTRI